MQVSILIFGDPIANNFEYASFFLQFFFLDSIDKYSKIFILSRLGFLPASVLALAGTVSCLVIYFAH